MAGQSVKKRLVENTALLRKYFFILVLGNAFYAFVRFYVYADSYQRFHIGAFCATSVIYFLAYSTLKSHALPGNADPDQVDYVGDLKQGGLIEGCWDVIYVSLFVQLTSLISDWFWLAWLLVPAYALWALWGSVISPMLSMRSAASEPYQSRRERRAKPVKENSRH